MDDPFFMCRSQGLGQGNGELEDTLDRHATARNQLRELLTVHQLHGQKTHTIGFFDRVDGDDVGMVESGEGLGLTLETGQPLGVGGQLGRQHLERHLAVQGRILGPVDLPHTTFAQLTGNSEVRQSGADQQS